MKNFKILFSSILTLTFLLQPIQVFAQNTAETQNLINQELSFEKTQDQNTLNTATATATAYLQKFDNFTLYENCTHRLCAFGKCQGFAFDLFKQ